jgi:hypothetical protein
VPSDDSISKVIVGNVKNTHLKRLGSFVDVLDNLLDVVLVGEEQSILISWLWVIQLIVEVLDMSV